MGAAGFRGNSSRGAPPAVPAARKVEAKDKAGNLIGFTRQRNQTMMVGLHSFTKRPDNEKTLFNDVHILNKELLDQIMLINDFHMVVEKRPSQVG